MEGRQLALVQSKTLSKDEYIAQLEAQLLTFKGNISKASSSGAALVSDSAVRMRDDNDGRSVRKFNMLK